jgi:hypothetical protein
LSRVWEAGEEASPERSPELIVIDAKAEEAIPFEVGQARQGDAEGVVSRLVEGAEGGDLRRARAAAGLGAGR